MENRRRVMKDLKAFKDDKNIQDLFGICLVEGSGDNLSSFEAIVTGPCDTPYESGQFKVELSVGEEYPYKAPTVKFITTIWHPNISKTLGTVCLDVLQSKWRPAMNFSSTLLSVQALLETPEPTSPLNSIAGRIMLNDKSMFEKYAKMWTYVLAKGQKFDADLNEKYEMVKALNVGTNDIARLDALTASKWDVEVAVDLLLSNTHSEEDDFAFLV